MTFRLLVATRNAGKAVEFARLLDLPDLTLVTLDELDVHVPDVVEDGDTFEANAIKKARETAAATGLLTLADDSGLEVDALHGAPGVYSARYAGAQGPEANVRKLLHSLAAVNEDLRTARFRCVLALADPRGPLGDRVELASGACEGRIVSAPRGTGGFGYDPVFVPRGEHLTMAELSAEAKDRLSHRGAACAKMRETLRAYLHVRPTDPG